MRNQLLSGLLSRLDSDVFDILRQISRFANDDGLNDSEKLNKIRSLLQDRKEDAFTELKTSHRAFQIKKWCHYDPQHVLQGLEKKLYEQYQTRNNNAITGKNLHLKFNENGSFRIATPALDEHESESLQQYFPERRNVPLTEVLATVNRHCGFLDDLQHWQQRHTRRSVSQRSLYAGVIGLGCGIGTRKMAQISSHITENELEHAVNWCFSLLWQLWIRWNCRMFTGVYKTSFIPQATGKNSKFAPIRLMPTILSSISVRS